MQIEVSNVAVRIERGHLHIGHDTYPLRNVARIQLRGWTAKPKPSQWLFVPVVAGSIGALTTGYSLFSDRAGMTGGNLLWFAIWLGVLTLGVLIMIRFWPRHRRLTILDVTSSGEPHRALVSDDEEGLSALRQRMIDAINDLEVTYHQEFRSYDIENFVGEVQPGGTGFVQQSN